MQTEIIVNIYNWNCVKNGNDMVLAVNDDGLILQPPRRDYNIQHWMLIPNVVSGAATGGYTLYNVGQRKAAEQPAHDQQIILNGDPTPYGSAAYCWTLWPTGEGNGEQLWSIQSYQRGDVMDAAKGGCDVGTEVLFWGWNGGDNQQWIISLAI